MGASRLSGKLIQIDSASAEQTMAVGAAIGALARAGDVIGLSGELGAGKTQMVRGVARGMGLAGEQVASPTFVLMQLYTDGRLPVAHFDTYRLVDQDEFVAIGGEEYLLDDETVCIVEWADRICDILPTDHLQITIQQTGETERAMTIVAGGDDSQAVLEKLKRVVETP